MILTAVAPATHRLPTTAAQTRPQLADSSPEDRFTPAQASPPAHPPHHPPARSWQARMLLNGQEGGPVLPGQPTRLEMAILDPHGNPVREFDLEHEKPMHMIVVSADLETFAHLHPNLTTRGEFSLDLNQPTADPDNRDAERAIAKAGPHLVFAEVKPRGQKVQGLALDLEASGQAAPVKLQPDLTGSGQVTRYFGADGQPGEQGAPYRVSFELDDMRGHGMIHLTFHLEKAVGDGYQPVQEAENWLGMPGHAIMIGADGAEAADRSFNHLHSGHHGHHAQPLLEGAGPDFPFMLHGQMPPDGVYKIWGQFKHEGQVVTFPFVFELS